MGVEDWSTDESQNLDLDGSDISRRASPGAPANELMRKLMAHVKELEGKIVSDGIEVDGVSIVNNDGTLTVVDVAIDGDTEDLLTEKIAEIEAAATQAGEDATAAQTAATQAAASAASVETSVTAAATAANVAAEQADTAARAAARAQSGAAMAESAVQAVISGTNLNWQKSEKAGAVAIYPVPETTLEPTVDFLFTETPPASGNKGPDNPSTIVGVSEVKVTRANSNLIRWPYYNSNGKELNGITWTVNADGSVSASGTATGASTFYFQLTSDYAVNGMLMPPGSYHYSGCPSGGGGNAYRLDVAISASYYPSRATKTSDYGSGGTLVVTQPALCSFYCMILQGQTVSNLLFKPTLQIDGVDVPFEKNEQDIYTVDLGGTFYGGTLNISTGTMTVTWAGKELTGTENWRLSSASTSEINEFFVGADSGLLPMSNAISNDTRSCSHFPLGNANVVADTFYTWGSAIRVIIRKRVSDIADVETFKSWLSAQHANGTPVTIVYELFTPQTVQLDPVQIYSLSQTDKYTPCMNTVYTDANSVQVGYAKSPIRSENELTQAIIATEGGE